MLHRIKKEVDENKDKWIGIGGKFEESESPEDCAVREIEEETGIKKEDLSNLKMRAVITFINPTYGDEYIHLFEAEYTGETDPTLTDCDEGELIWVPKSDVYSLPIWEGDKAMFDAMFMDDEFFTLKLVYDGDNLTGVFLNS